MAGGPMRQSGWAALKRCLRGGSHLCYFSPAASMPGILLVSTPSSQLASAGCLITMKTRLAFQSRGLFHSYHVWVQPHRCHQLHFQGKERSIAQSHRAGRAEVPLLSRAPAHVQDSFPKRQHPLAGPMPRAQQPHLIW